MMPDSVRNDVETQTVSSTNHSKDEKYATEHTVALASVFALLAAALVTIAVAFALHDCDLKQATRYAINLTVNNQGPEIYVTDSISFWFGTGDGRTWYFQWYPGEEDLPYPTFTESSSGWFDKILKVRHIGDDFMDAELFVDNRATMNRLFSGSSARLLNVTEPECDYPTRHVDIYSVPLDGGESEEFPLAICRVARLDEEYLEPRQIEIVFSGTVSIAREDET